MSTPALKVDFTSHLRFGLTFFRLSYVTIGELPTGVTPFGRTSDRVVYESIPPWLPASP